MIVQSSTLYTEGSLVSFQSEVIEENERVFHIKSHKNFITETKALEALTLFWANYPKTDDKTTLDKYLQEYSMEVNMLGLVQ